jgi:hypothetical protein
MTTDNLHLQVPSKLMQCIRFWEGQTLTQCGDKGGSFNVDLYFRYLEAKARKW